AYNVVTGAVQLTIDLLNLTNNVDLFVQRAPPLTNFTVFNGDPSGYPFASTNAGTNGESVCIATNSPVSLDPGVWFISVVNRETNPAPYCLRASLLASNSFVQLTNGVAACSQFSSGTDIRSTNSVRYFTFNVASNAIAVNFEAFNITGGYVD